MSETLDRKFIKTGLRKIGLMSEEPTPEEEVLEELSARMTRGVSESQAMRVELYLMDVIDAVKGGGGRGVEALLEMVKQGDGFAGLSTEVVVPDSTTLALLSEVKEKLERRRSEEERP